MEKKPRRSVGGKYTRIAGTSTELAGVRIGDALL